MALLVLASLVALAMAQMPIFTHTQLLNLTTARQSVFPTSAGGRVYLVGGCISPCDPAFPNQFLKSIEVFDFNASVPAHYTLGNMMNPRSIVSTVANDAGMLLLYGGAGTSPPLATGACAAQNWLEIYNTSASVAATNLANTWPTQSDAGTTVCGDWALFAGGQNCGQRNSMKNTISAYNLRTKIFGNTVGKTIKKDTGNYGRCNIAALANGTHVLFAGGQQDGSTPNGAVRYVDVFLVDSGPNVTAPLTPAPLINLSVGRAKIAAVHAAGLWIFAGGYNNLGVASNVVDIFDRSFLLATRYLSPRSSGLTGAVGFLDRYLLVSGGAHTCFDYMDLQDGILPFLAANFTNVTVGGLPATDKAPGASILRNGITTDLAIFPQSSGVSSKISVIQISFPTTLPPPTTAPPPTSSDPPSSSPVSAAPGPASTTPIPGSSYCELPQPPTAVCIDNFWVIMGSLSLISPLQLGNTPLKIYGDLTQNGLPIELWAPGKATKWITNDKTRQAPISAISVSGTANLTAPINVIIGAPMQTQSVQMHVMDSSALIIGMPSVTITTSYDTSTVCEKYEAKPSYDSGISVLLHVDSCSHAKRKWLPGVITVSVLVGVAIIAVAVIVLFLRRTCVWSAIQGRAGDDQYGLLK